MAVFTEVTSQAAAALMAHLGLGQVQSMQGITAGIENTNYFVDTAQGRYVLTVFERLGFDQLPFYLQLMQHLARKCIPVPEPRATLDGTLLHQIDGKPVAVVNRLPGQHQLAPQPQHCASVGNMLARMHLAGQDFPLEQANLRGLVWWLETAPVVAPYLSPAQRELLTSELGLHRTLASTRAAQNLPRGPIHADLFRDNALFQGEQLTGLFDFYFAGTDCFVFDIAVCLNDWCINQDSGQLDPARAQAFITAYHAQRPLSLDEQALLPSFLRAAALRFWLSRLWDVYLPRPASMLTPHDPQHFERVLRQRVAHPWHAKLD
jgi:homoserine kinase type II